jgi:starch phosphorylase
MSGRMKMQLFSVAPVIPKELQFLEVLAHNLWWCWNQEALELFRRIDPLMWKDAGHNPLVYLISLPQKQLEILVEDEGFMRHLQEVKAKFEAVVRVPTNEAAQQINKECIAYFSLEFGIHESLGFYSGGLGVLAGDHLKAASDLNTPLVSVGLLYRQGYFRQQLNSDGWQQEHYPESPVQNLPLNRVADAGGQQLHVSLTLPEGVLKACVWRIDVGRVPLYLLDTNIPDNPPDFRAITAQLYGGDRQTRLQQELLLGIGGFRALLAMGYNPHVCHINEGHAAFLSIARIEHLMKACNLDLNAAAWVVARTNVFTTHTPVPAGNETFHLDLLRPYLQAVLSGSSLTPEKVIGWGQGPGWPGHELSMTILGLRLSHDTNGVSELHGKVARRMWSKLWPGQEESEIPIRHVTNGVHVPSWLSPDLSALFDRYLGPQWRTIPNSTRVLHQISQIPDDELWRGHELSRARLVRVARMHMEEQCNSRNASRSEFAQIRSVLDHEALTIGFARRFATYKRATLILRNMERLEAILCNTERPVQIIFAGKSHPADDQGKEFIRQLVKFSQKPSVHRRIVFLENYDISLARSLVQGVDVWLNTPQRPHEASGTSGMKAGANGVLNASTLDGWWCEGYAKETGWAIGHGEEHDDPEYQATVESESLYSLLENEIVPCFYDRSSGDIPSAWLRMMKASIHMVLSKFTSHRMVSDYRSMFYDRAFNEYTGLLSNQAAAAHELVQQENRLASLWSAVRVDAPATSREMAVLHVGDSFSVSCPVHLGQLTPEEVDVEVYYGPVDSQNRITDRHVEKMEIAEDRGLGNFLYRQDVRCPVTGRYGFTTRAMPRNASMKKAMPGFIAWADGN